MTVTRVGDCKGDRGTKEVWGCREDEGDGLRADVEAAYDGREEVVESVCSMVGAKEECLEAQYVSQG